MLRKIGIALYGDSHSTLLHGLVNAKLTKIKMRSNLHYTRDITPKRVTSGGAHLRGLAPGGQHNFAEKPLRCRTVGITASDLTDPGIEFKISRTDSNVLTTELTAGMKSLLFP